MYQNCTSSLINCLFRYKQNQVACLIQFFNNGDNILRLIWSYILLFASYYRQVSQFETLLESNSFWDGLFVWVVPLMNHLFGILCYVCIFIISFYRFFLSFSFVIRRFMPTFEILCSNRLCASHVQFLIRNKHVQTSKSWWNQERCCCCCCCC